MLWNTPSTVHNFLLKFVIKFSKLTTHKHAGKPRTGRRLLTIMLKVRPYETLITVKPKKI